MIITPKSHKLSQTVTMKIKDWQKQTRIAQYALLKWQCEAGVGLININL